MRRPVGRYGVYRQVRVAALWLGVAALAAAVAVLAAGLWVVRVVGAWVWVLASRTRERVAVLDLVMDGPPRAEGPAGSGGVVEGVVVSVRYEDKETVES